MTKRTRYEGLINDCEDWVKKCYNCKHQYVRKNDADEMKCSCRTGCHYSPFETPEINATLRRAL